jgi:pilus assembly protein Flp/PilA
VADGGIIAKHLCEGVGQMLRTVSRHSVRFLKAEDGPTAVEYAVMLALIIVVCIGAVTTLGQRADATFQDVALNGTLSGS